MSIAVTYRKMQEEFICVKVPYCKLAHLLSCDDKHFHTESSYYGWRCDWHIQPYGKIAICTGYAPVGHEVPNWVLQTFEDYAIKAQSWQMRGLLLGFYRLCYSIIVNEAEDWEGIDRQWLEEAIEDCYMHEVAI